MLGRGLRDWHRWLVQTTSGHEPLGLTVQAQPFLFLDQVRGGVESTQVADLGVTLGTGVVVGRVRAADVELCFTQRAVDFGLLGFGWGCCWGHNLHWRCYCYRWLLLLLLSRRWGLMLLYWPFIHMGRLRMYLLLHSHCLLLHAWLLLGLLQGCGLGPSELTRRTAHVTVTHWPMRSSCLPCLKTAHSKLFRAMLLLLLLLLPPCVWPCIAKQHFPFRRTGLRGLCWERVYIDQSASLV